MRIPWEMVLSFAIGLGLMCLVGYLLLVPMRFIWRLAAGGVQIYEYTPGFIHAKQFVADDKAAAVGTINLDYRSLYLHFENGCWFCGCQAVQDVRADFEALFPQCENVTPQYSGQRSLALRGVQCVFRLFSPLM